MKIASSRLWLQKQRKKLISIHLTILDYSLIDYIYMLHMSYHLRYALIEWITMEGVQIFNPQAES